MSEDCHDSNNLPPCKRFIARRAHCLPELWEIYDTVSKNVSERVYTANSIVADLNGDSDFAANVNGDDVIGKYCALSQSRSIEQANKDNNVTTSLQQYIVEQTFSHEITEDDIVRAHGMGILLEIELTNA